MEIEVQLRIVKARFERSPKRKADWIRYVHSAEAIRRFWQ